MAKRKPKKRERLGCDCCHNVFAATECFEGYCGNILWLCHRCLNHMIKGWEIQA